VSKNSPRFCLPAWQPITTTVLRQGLGFNIVGGFDMCPRVYAATPLYEDVVVLCSAIISQVNEKKKPVVYIQFCFSRSATFGLGTCLLACVSLAYNYADVGWLHLLYIFDVFYFVIRQQQRQQPHKSLLITFPLQTQTHTHSHTHISHRVFVISHYFPMNL